MDVTITKTVLAFVLLGLGVATAGTMLALQGKSDPPDKPGRLRTLHRTTGYLFATVLVALAVLGATILHGARDALPLRGVVHWVLGGLLLLVAALKIVLVRYYKKFLKFAPTLGLTILVLGFLVAMVSAGFVLVTGELWSDGTAVVRDSEAGAGAGGAPNDAADGPESSGLRGDVALG
ncbi:MAG: hypothetical protein GF400_08585, partial [Candidatus Eisenbacteria bacterium]|nr:hypothetical protein [Candidatus Eisenbacteria bacterium]